MQELEEDPEMRQRVALFKDANYDAAAAAAARMSAMTEDEEDDLPEVCCRYAHSNCISTFPLPPLLSGTLGCRPGGIYGLMFAYFAIWPFIYG